VWKFGAVYCKVNTFISYLSVTASVFTLLALTVDRRKVSHNSSTLRIINNGGKTTAEILQK
jgi:7 transmembrane receptor (rhodopsin family)